MKCHIIQVTGGAKVIAKMKKDLTIQLTCLYFSIAQF